MMANRKVGAISSLTPASDPNEPRLLEDFFEILNTTDPDPKILDTTSNLRFAKAPGSPTHGFCEEVYNGIDRDTGNEVVWRDINPGKVDSNKFLEELNRAIGLDCKHLVKYLYCEKKVNGEIILITESITTGPLSFYLKNYRNPRLTICKSWLSQILCGIGYLHSQGITHGHLSCENILINSNTGEIKIGNLVLAKLGEMGGSRPPNPAHDIKCFGLIALEVGIAKFFSPEKLKKIMQYLYKTHGGLSDKVKKLIGKISEPPYRDFIELCLSGDKRVTAKKLLTHEFFTGWKTERTSSENKINISVNIETETYSKNISFLYDLDKDTVEGIIREMKKDLRLPDTFLKVIQQKIEAEVCKERLKMLEDKETDGKEWQKIRLDSEAKQQRYSAMSTHSSITDWEAGSCVIESHYDETKEGQENESLDLTSKTL